MYTFYNSHQLDTGIIIMAKILGYVCARVFVCKHLKCNWPNQLYI